MVVVVRLLFLCLLPTVVVAVGECGWDANYTVNYDVAITYWVPQGMGNNWLCNTDLILPGPGYMEIKNISFETCCDRLWFLNLPAFPSFNQPVITGLISLPVLSVQLTTDSSVPSYGFEMTFVATPPRCLLNSAIRGSFPPNIGYSTTGAYGQYFYENAVYVCQYRLQSYYQAILLTNVGMDLKPGDTLTVSDPYLNNGVLAVATSGSYFSSVVSYSTDIIVTFTSNNLDSSNHYGFSLDIAQTPYPQGPNGSPCAFSVNCFSGYCVGGVCCNGNCGSQCQSCSTGTCVYTDVGECMCDASSAFPCGQIQACPPEYPCGGFYNCIGNILYQNVLGSCSYTDGCSSGVPCPNNLMCNTGGSCLTQCGSDADCVSGYVCSGAQCIAVPTSTSSSSSSSSSSSTTLETSSSASGETSTSTSASLSNSSSSTGSLSSELVAVLDSDDSAGALSGEMVIIIGASAGGFVLCVVVILLAVLFFRRSGGDNDDDKPGIQVGVMAAANPSFSSTSPDPYQDTDYNGYGRTTPEPDSASYGRSNYQNSNPTNDYGNYKYNNDANNSNSNYGYSSAPLSGGGPSVASSQVPPSGPPFTAPKPVRGDRSRPPSMEPNHTVSVKSLKGSSPAPSPRVKPAFLSSRPPSLAPSAPSEGSGYTTRVVGSGPGGDGGGGGGGGGSGGPSSMYASGEFGSAFNSYTSTLGSFSPETLQIEGMESLKVVGRGGQATVYSGFSFSLGELVCIKIFTTEAMFSREYSVLSSVPPHPNIIAIVSVPNLPPWSIGLALASRGSVMSHLSEFTGSARKSEAVSLAQDVAIGLGHLHDHGVSHLDIKPANVLVNSNSFGKTTAVITDFGAAFSKGRVDLRLDMCTLKYSAPEVLAVTLGSSMADAGVLSYTGLDVYSFGVTLFEMVSGVEPFKGFDQQAVLDLYTSSPAKFAVNVSQLKDKDVRGVVELCLRSSDFRPRTMTEVMAMLLKI